MALAVWAGVALGQDARPALLTISQKRVLNDTAAARALREAEVRLTAALQERVDRVKADLGVEEAQLTADRTTLAREEFDAKVAAFDQKVRRERRQTQRRAAALQTAFREERRKLVEALAPILARVRAAKGALVVLNADEVVASDPAIDVTDEVIALFDRLVPVPPIPDLDELDPGPDTEPEPDSAQPTPAQP